LKVTFVDVNIVKKATVRRNEAKAPTNRIGRHGSRKLLLWQSHDVARTMLAAAAVRSDNVAHGIAPLDSTDRRSEVTDMRENISAAIVRHYETKASR
jgi:hypothetical protein